MYDNYINACEDILVHGRTEDADAAALAIRDGYIERREDGRLFVTAPAFTKAQKEQFDQIVERHLVPLAEDYFARVADFLDGYGKLFPQHLTDAMARQGRQMYFEMYDAIAAYAEESGEGPALEERTICDVLIQFKN